MATLQKATYTGPDDIMTAFDYVTAKGDENYAYSVWHSQKEIAFQYCGADYEKGRQRLSDCLEAMQQAENDNLIYIKFHPYPVKGGFVTKNTDVVCMMPVRCIELDNTHAPAIGNSGTERPDYKMYKAMLAMEELPAKIETQFNTATAAINERLRLLEEAEYEEVPEKEDLKTIIVGQIGSLLKDPQAVQGIIGMLAPAIGALIKSIVPQFKMPVMPQNNTISGTGPETVEQKLPDIDMVNTALQRLTSHCDLDTDLTLLADMAEKNPMQFKMMLSMLRNSK